MPILTDRDITQLHQHKVLLEEMRRNNHGHNIYSRADYIRLYPAAKEIVEKLLGEKILEILEP
jgi:hypothetical protein